MKRFRLLSILLALAMCLALVACGGDTTGADSGYGSTGQGSGSATNEPPTDGTSGEAGGEPVTPAGRVLVVYFSASGNTKKIAGYIAEITGGTMFELVPVNPYTADDLNWRDSGSRVVAEHNNPDRHVELTTTQVENWEAYETVFIGYPIWWQEAAWAVDDFVKNNDFTGKTVIPFCTSSSSGIGNSGELLAQMAGTGDWQEGKRFSSSASKSKVEEWIILP